MLPFVPPNSPSSLVCPRKNIKELSFPLASGWGSIVGSTSKWQERGRDYEQCSYFFGSLSAKLLRISCALGWNTMALSRMYVLTFFSSLFSRLPPFFALSVLGGQCYSCLWFSYTLPTPLWIVLLWLYCALLGEPWLIIHLAGMAGKCSHSTDVICLGLPLCHLATVHLFSDQRWFLA